MKKILLGVSALMLGAVMSSQAQLLVEHFDYTAGTTLDSNGWDQTQTNGLNPIYVGANSLTFPSYSPTAIGGSAVSYDNGQDISSLFNTVTNGNVYASFLMRVDTIGSSGYFFHFMDAAASTSFRARTFFQTDATNSNAFNFGLTFNSSTGVFDTTEFVKGDTILVVVKYQIVSGVNNDSVSLYAFNMNGSFTTEPSTPLLGPVAWTGSSAAPDIDPARVALRQFGNNDVVFDAFMVDTVWNLMGTVTPPPTPGVPTYTISTISTVDANGVADSLGVVCWTKGIVMGVDLDGNAGYSFTIWDNDGINIFSVPDVDGYVVTEGDSIMVLGTVGQFNGLTQFVPDSIVLVNQGNAIPAPTVISSLSEMHESELVRIENFYVIDNPSNTSTFNVTLSNGTDTVTVRIDSDTDIDGNVMFHFGDTVCYIIGIGGQFDNSNPYTSGYQLFPQRASDVDNSCGSIPPPPVPFYPIADINNVDANGEPDSVGVYCWTKGLVLGIDLDGNAGISFTLYDAQEGINVFNFVDVGTYVVTEGDSLMVRGAIDFYNGLTEIVADSITVLNQGNALPAPKTVTTLAEENESTPIRLFNVTVVNPSQWPGTSTSGWNVDVVTCSGDTVVMRIDLDTDVDDMIPSAPTGTFTVSGIGGQFDNATPFDGGYQIFPMSYLDIDTTTDYSTPTFFVNEIMSDNDSVIMDENNEYDDWAELYNPGTTDIMLAGMFFTDNAAEPMKYQVPSNSTAVIPAGGYALVWCDNSPEQGDLHTNFALSAGGEYFGVTSYDGCAMVDGFDFPALETNESYGRKTDGNDTLVTFPTWSTTPNAMNMLDTVNSVGEIDFAANQLVVYPNPSNGNNMVRFNKNITFEVYDMLGNKVSSARNSRELNIANLRSGAYLIKTDNGEVIRMIVK